MTIITGTPLTLENAVRLVSAEWRPVGSAVAVTLVLLAPLQNACPEPCSCRS
jgi:hypothetical protein